MDTNIVDISILDTAHATRYVARTAIGKPLYIVAETKAINGATNQTISHYSLSEDLVDAAKCVNKTTVKTLIDDYISATGSTKTFNIYRVDVKYTMNNEDSVNE